MSKAFHRAAGLAALAFSLGACSTSLSPNTLIRGDRDQIAGLQTELAAAQAETQQLRTQLEAARETRETCQAENEEHAETIERLQAEIDRLRGVRR